MQEPLVSVIIPVYNTEKYVARTIRSICNQTYLNLEIILVNDGSPDNAELECLKCSNEDSRVKYYWQENKGVSSARNLGIKKATGDYILFCDSDDVWRSDLLELVVKQMLIANCDMVRFGCKSDNEAVYPSDSLPEGIVGQRDLLVEYFSNNIIYRNMSSCCWGIYIRQIIVQNQIEFREDLRRGEDSVFVMQYATYCDKVAIVNKPLYLYYPCFDDRVNATARNLKELYNEYELCDLLFQEFYNKWNKLLLEEEKAKAYSGFFDRVIGRLVRFAAYSGEETRIKDIAKLREFLSKPYVREAGQYYKRTRKTDSRLVPFLMKNRMISLLWMILRGKRNRYYKMYGKKQYAESIWKRDKLNEINKCRTGNTEKENRGIKKRR